MSSNQTKTDGKTASARKGSASYDQQKRMTDKAHNARWQYDNKTEKFLGMRELLRFLNTVIE